MRFLILLAVAAVAAAETGWMEPVCPDPTAYLFRTSREAICLHLHRELVKFEDAMKQCFEKKSRLVMLTPDTRKIAFLSHMIVEHMGDLNATAWFTDPGHMPHQPAEENARLVIIAHQDPRMIKIVRNDSDVERPFVCESPAQPTSERPQFYLQPEDVQISDKVVKAFQMHETKETEETKTKETKTEEEPKKPRAFTVSFNCRAFALPKPTIEWMQIYENNTHLVTKMLDAKVIHSLPEAMKQLEEEDSTKTLFFDRRRDCSRHHCHPDGIMETSELIIVNPQLLNLEHRIVCVARNTAGAVLSREAEIIVNHMADFPEEEEKLSVEAGKNITIPCELATEPDASAEWFRFIDGRLMAIENFNRLTKGSMQTSKATFDLFIDAAQMQDAGMYVCRVQMHNGRFHFEHRDRKVVLEVTPCKENCDLSKKPVQVLEGYPTVLSMNPMSNEHIRTGDAFLLECPCSGKRDPQELLRVEWNETETKLRPLGLLPMGSVMLVEQAKQEHTGTYACRCVREEEKSAWKTVDVSVLPLFAPLELPLAVAKVGEVANISCQLPNVHINGVTVSVTPMRGIRSLFDILAENKDERFGLTDNEEKYTIAIRNAEEKDAGIYGFRLAIDYFGMWTEHDTYYTTLSIVQ